MSTIRVVNLQHPDSVEPNVVLKTDGTAVFASGITISGSTNLTVSGTAEFASGTAANPEITFIDDNDTGIYSPAANEVAITTSGTERLRVDDGGNVGIGTTNPQKLLTLGSTTESDQRLSLFSLASSNNDAYGSIEFRHGVSTGNINCKISALRMGGSSGGVLAFSTRTQADAVNTDGGEERMRIDSRGNVGIGTSNPSTFAGDCELAVAKAGGARFGISGSSRTFFVQGNTSNDQLDFGRRTGGNTTDDIIFSARADGITFNGDTAAANELSDYEEGTWTPSLTDALTYTQREGQYTKIGNFVYVQARIQVATFTSTSNPAIISGLPFTTASSVTTGGFGSAYFGFGTLATNVTSNEVALHMPVNQTQIQLRAGGSRSSLIAVNNSVITYTRSFIVCGSYRVA